MKKIFFMLFCFLTTSGLFAQIAENPVDEQGNRHGVWKQYYPKSKQLRYEGEFHHGKEVGTFKFYCEACKDKPNVIKKFNPDNNIAEVQFLNNGKIVGEGKMDGKEFIGTWIYYHKNGKQIMTEEHYVQGQLEGKKIIFFPNGKVAEEQFFKKGVKDGPNNYYSKDGVLLKKLQYKNNQLHGPAVYYDPRGAILAEGNYKEGVRHGKWRYYENGKFKKEEILPKR